MLVAVHGVEEDREGRALVFLDLVADHEVQEAHAAQRVDVGMHRRDHAVGRFQRAARQEGRVGVGVEDDEIVFAAIVIDRAQEMLLDGGEGVAVVREGVFRNLELAGDQVEPSGRTVRTQNTVDEAVTRGRREGRDGEAQPVLGRRRRILGMQARALEQRDDGAVDAGGGVRLVHAEEGLCEVVLRVEVDQQDAAAEGFLPGAGELRRDGGLPHAALQVHHRDDRAFLAVGRLHFGDQLVHPVRHGGGEAQVRLDFLLEEAVQARLVDLVGDDADPARLGGLDILAHRFRAHGGGGNEHDDGKSGADIGVRLVPARLAGGVADRDGGAPQGLVQLQQRIGIGPGMADIDMRHAQRTPS